MPISMGELSMMTAPETHLNEQRCGDILRMFGTFAQAVGEPYHLPNCMNLSDWFCSCGMIYLTRAVLQVKEHLENMHGVGDEWA